MFAEALRHELSGTGVSLTPCTRGRSPRRLHEHEKDRMPDWYRGGPAAVPASELAAKVLDGVESDARSVAHPPVVRLLGALHNTAPRASDALLRRLRGGTAAPRRD